ncbi:MAG TPA: hypothetical protein VM240_00960 [Verrucomicrobiae bacterium]|nr:hypothetical protein [Verrucomicrobiae bacterium]
MPKILCSVQQGQVPRDRWRALESGMRATYAQHLGASTLLVAFTEVPRGQGWTEGRISDVSWLMVEVADGLPQVRREAAMRALAAEWARVGGVRVDQILITLCDTRMFAQYLAANRQRLRPARRLPYLLRLAFNLWTTKRRDGVASLPANL